MPSVRCPGCKAVLKLKAAPPAGKRLKCPQCETRFAPAVKAKPQIEILEDDDWGDDGGDLYEPLAPSSRRRAGGGTKKRKASGGDGLPPAVWIGLAAAVVLVLGGVGAWAIFGGGGGPVEGSELAGGGAAADDGPTLRPAVAPPFPADRLPADADTFLHLRVADVWNDPTVGAAIPPAGRVAGEAATAPYGLSPADIDSITVAGPIAAGFAAMIEAVGADPQRAMAIGQQMGQQALGGAAVAVRLNRDFDIAALAADRELERLLAPIEVEGAVGTVYRAVLPGEGGRPGAASDGDFALWQPDPRTVILGRSDRVRELAAASGSPDPAAAARPGFAGAADGTLTLALAPVAGLLALPSRAEIEASETEEPPPGAGEFLERYEAVRTDAAGVTVTLDLAARPQAIRFSFPARDPADAAAVGRLEEAAEALLAAIGDLREPDPGDESGLNLARSLVIEMVRGATVTTDDGVVTLTLPAPDDLRARLEAMSGG